MEMSLGGLLRTPTCDTAGFNDSRTRAMKDQATGMHLLCSFRKPVYRICRTACVHCATSHNSGFMVSGGREHQRVCLTSNLPPKTGSRYTELHVFCQQETLATRLLSPGKAHHVGWLLLWAGLTVLCSAAVTYPLLPPAHTRPEGLKSDARSMPRYALC